MGRIFRISLMLLTALFVCLCVGRFPMGPGDVAGLILSGLGFDNHFIVSPRDMGMVFWNIRVPRLVLTILAGAGISTAGAVFQALFRNPLAAPEILGVTAGSCFGAAFAIMYLSPLAWVIQGSAFLFGTIAVTFAYILANFSNDTSPAVLVISGIVTSALFKAGLAFMMYLSNPHDQLTRIIFWTMGSFHTASWTKIEITLPLLLPGIILMIIFSWRLNIMTQDTEDAMSMGINIFRWRIFFVAASTLMVACSVACVGSIAWIGLIVPHIARYLTGPDNRKLIPATAVLGGCFLMVMDSVARSVTMSEIPISIVTSIFGAPFLGYLVVNAGKKRFYNGPGH